MEPESLPGHGADPASPLVRAAACLFAQLDSSPLEPSNEWRALAPSTGWTNKDVTGLIERRGGRTGSGFTDVPDEDVFQTVELLLEPHGGLHV